MSTGTQEPLDNFDIALLAQLRSEVTKEPARRVRRGALSLGGVAAASAAAIVGVTVFGSSAPAAAYAVDRGTNGDITITIHRLSDAAGLEKQLASYGIKAHVSYQAARESQAPGDAAGGVDLSPMGQGDVGGSVITGQASAGSASNGSLDRNAGGGACGDPSHPAFTANLGSNDYVITIPKASPLQHADSELSITTTGDVSKTLAGLSVDYTVDGQHCGMGSLSVGAPGLR